MEAPETAAAWLAVLLNGTVGSALSLIGLFLTFWLTLRADRKREERRRDEEDLRARNDRTSRNTADLLNALSSPLDGRVSWTDLRSWEEGVENAMLRFSLLEQGPHRDVSGWMLAQMHYLRDAMKKCEDAAAAGADTTEATSEMVKLVGRVTGVITTWAAGTRDDKWFEGRDHKYAT